MRHARLWLLLLVAVAAFISSPDRAGAFANGRGNASELAPINTGFSCDGLRGQLANPAAAGYNTMSLAAGRPLPTNGCASAYRPIGTSFDGCSAGTQWGFWNCYGAGRAAYPGTSNHGFGLAVDVPPATRATIDSSQGIFGFDKACSDAPHEYWHVKYCRVFTRPDPGLNRVSPTLRRGSGGPGQAPYVRQLQHLLRRAGAKQLTVDGDFGKRTSRALKTYQRAHGLKPDGVTGPKVWKRLRGPVTRDHRHRKVAERLKTSGPVQGVDVSEHQGSINWSAVAGDGIEFAIVKATEGEDYRDHYFSRDRLEAIAAQGIVPGAYHFLRPRPGRPGSREATFFLQTIQSAGYGVGFLRPVLDVEVTELSPAATCDYLHSAVLRIKKQLGTKPIIYTGPYFASVYLAGCGNWLARLPLWVAHYGVSSPTTPPPWSGWMIWQHTYTAAVDGIVGGVDHNVMPGGLSALDSLLLRAADQGHGGDPGDGQHDPVDGQHRTRPPCSSKAHPHRCRLNRRCKRGGHPRACRRYERLQERLERLDNRPRRVTE